MEHCINSGSTATLHLAETSLVNVFKAQ